MLCNGDAPRLRMDRHRGRSPGKPLAQAGADTGVQRRRRDECHGGERCQKPKGSRQVQECVLLQRSGGVIQHGPDFEGGRETPSLLRLPSAAEAREWRCGFHPVSAPERSHGYEPRRIEAAAEEQPHLRGPATHQPWHHVARRVNPEPELLSSVGEVVLVYEAQQG